VQPVRPSVPKLNVGTVITNGKATVIIGIHQGSMHRSHPIIVIDQTRFEAWAFVGAQNGYSDFVRTAANGVSRNAPCRKVMKDMTSKRPKPATRP
jgi:hypothetical protein